MRLLTTSIDSKIKAKNHLLEISIGEYISIAKDILTNNDLQRKRVKSSTKTYSLLKDDIKEGCVIPPIVLAIFPKEPTTTFDLTEENIIQRLSAASNDLLILDGLQRTYTILDLVKEIASTSELLEKVNQQSLRIEVYTGISKVGVLYRMLTLNTGQTPMSTRQQVEMLYSDYKNGVDGLTFIAESENKMPSGDKEFRFNDILDCFLSYITGSYLPVDNEDLVSIIKNLETLTKEDKQKDLFRLLIESYDLLRSKIQTISNHWNYDTQSKELKKKPFANNTNELFSKGQLLAGYGAALSSLIEKELLLNIEDAKGKIDSIKNEDISDGLNQMIKHLDDIQMNAKKIGNGQRMYFFYFISCLLNTYNDGYLDVNKAINEAYKYYKANA